MHHRINSSISLRPLSCCAQQHTTYLMHSCQLVVHTTCRTSTASNNAIVATRAQRGGVMLRVPTAIKTREHISKTPHFSECVSHFVKSLFEFLFFSKFCGFSNAVFPSHKIRPLFHTFPLEISQVLAQNGGQGLDRKSSVDLTGKGVLKESFRQRCVCWHVD